MIIQRQQQQQQPKQNVTKHSSLALLNPLILHLQDNNNYSKNSYNKLFS